MRLKYIGDADREYPGLGISPAVPGEVYELKEDPGDGRWESAELPPPVAAEEFDWDHPQHPADSEE